ncbi:hypothetical protein [Bradyrhizobium sp.]|uniref:hypothetical protein n=1 Tax=Bradyrhizobium sp. TaxID=376 RepID=UPI00262AA4DF|nr:hypothetical protein [Bradyrhizobium sp.]
MSSRAPIFAAVTVLIGCLVGRAACAQNLDAGKSPSQLFAGACNACHKSPRGLLKTVSPGALSGFLREHYTTSGDMASQLATYLISNGASDNKQARQGADKQGQGGNDQADHQGRKNRNAPSQEAARPDDASPPAEGGGQGRKRQARPAEPPEEGKPAADTPAQADTERTPDGRRLSAKQRKKPGKLPAAEEPSMANEPGRTEPARTEPARTEPARAESGADDKTQVEPKQEMGDAAAKPDAEMKPHDEVKPEPAKSETAKTEAPADSVSGDKPAVRHGPVQAVTAAPPAALSAPAPGSAPAGTSGAVSEPAASRSPASIAAEPQAVTASAPPPPRPAGPPAPPISQ